MVNPAVSNPKTSEDKILSKEPEKKPLPSPLKKQFGFFAPLCLFTAVLWTFCFFRNPHGLTYVFFVAAAYGVFPCWAKKLGLSLKPDGWYLAGAAFVLALNTCFTASPALHWLNNAAQILLAAVFLLHQRFDDQNWGLGRYLSSILRLIRESLFSLPLPVCHLTAFVRSLESAKAKTILMLGAGAAAALPVLFYLSLILAKADAVFQSMLFKSFTWLFSSDAMAELCILFIFGFFVSYSLLGGLCSPRLIPEKSERKRRNPMAAVSFCAMISLLYLFFCGIQIIYLFAGKGNLPEGMTYAQYAREGFFQLFFVALMNLVLVLACLSLFRPHPALNFCLTLISLCTYVLIGSSAYRMLLYVSTYALTFLRILVLWFLAVLALLFAGVIIAIFKPRFSLFRWFLVWITLAYCGFAWSRPDYQIARYNIAQEGGMLTENNAPYLLSQLSADAAPAIAQARIAPELWGKTYSLSKEHGRLSLPLNETWQMISCLKGIPWFISRQSYQPIDQWIQESREACFTWDSSLRCWNASFQKAWELSIKGKNQSFRHTDGKALRNTPEPGF